MKLLTFLVCDDIRMELGQKHSVIGVYDDRIAFRVAPDRQNSWPKLMKIGFFMKIILEEEIPNSMVFKITLNGKHTTFFPERPVNMNRENPKKLLTAALVHNHFKFTEPGEMQFRIEFYNADKQLIEALHPELTLQITEEVVQLPPGFQMQQ